MTSIEKTTLAALWADIQTHLEIEKRAATQEIRNYPQPIAGCDAQIPALWERRDSVVEDLTRLTDLNEDGSANALKKFMMSCSTLSTEDKQIFIDRLRPLQGLSAAE